MASPHDDTEKCPCLCPCQCQLTAPAQVSSLSRSSLVTVPHRVEVDARRIDRWTVGEITPHRQPTLWRLAEMTYIYA